MWNSVAVFCGSKKGKNVLFAQHAKEVAQLIAKSNIRLIYGGAKQGLMGVIADTVLESGGEVTGVIPAILNEKEHQHNSLTALHVVETMHERKKMMYELSDAAIILPGGYGTLDEMFEMITWNQLNIHNKKIVLLNSAGYFDHLIAHVQQMQDEGFLYAEWKQTITIIPNPQALLSLMDEDTHQSRRV